MLSAEYNILRGLSGLGEALFLHIIRTMSDPQDIQTFLALQLCTSQVQTNSHFPWALEKLLAARICSLLLPHDVNSSVRFFFPIMIAS